MQTDFSSLYSHPAVECLTIEHRDTVASDDRDVLIGKPERAGTRWTIVADHSYFTGKVTEFKFSAVDPALASAAIQGVVHAAVIRHQSRMFEMLASINSEVINSLDGSKIVHNVMHEVRHVLEACDAGVLRLFDEKSGYLVPVAQEGLPEDYREYRLLPNESISGEVFTTHVAARLNGRSEIIAAHRVMRPESQSFMERSDIANALMCVPIMAEGKSLGTLTTLCFSQSRFAPFDLAILQLLAVQIAIGYQRSQAYQAAMATTRELEMAREELTRKNRALDGALSLHEALLRIFSSEADLSSQLEAVAALFHVDFRFESILGGAYRTNGWTDSDEMETFRQDINAAGITAGFFMVRIGEEGANLRALFGTVATFVALEFMRDASRLDLLNARRAAWFDDLARGQSDVRLTQFGFTLERHFSILSIDVRDGETSLTAYRVQTRLQNTLSNHNALVFRRGDAVIAVVSASTAAALARSLKPVERIARAENLQIGASAPRDSSLDMNAALTEAAHAAAAARRRGAPMLLRYSDLGIEQLFAGRSRSEVLNFYHRILAPLTDPRHAVLHETLMAYVDQGRSASRAAQVLEIHQNTLYQRLQRIESLTGRNLSKPSDQTLLGLACQIGMDYADSSAKGDA